MAAVPQIDGLTVEDMLDLAKKTPNTLKHLPDQRDWDHMDRKWLADILFTVDRVKFEKMTKDAVKERKERLEEKRNLMIEMRPEFAAAFNNCMSFSSKVYSFLIVRDSGEWQSLQPDEVVFEAQAHQGGTRECQAGGRGAQK